MVEGKHTEDHPIHVLMVGPGRNVMGGISAVENLIIENMPAHISIRHIPTMVDGSKLRKLITFLISIPLILGAVFRGVDVVHVHFASRASNRRKMFLGWLLAHANAKVVLHAHGGGYRSYWTEMSWPVRWVTTRALRKAERLIVLGQTWRDFFVQCTGVDESKVLVLPNPVQVHSSNYLSAKVASQAAERKELKALFLGAIRDRKGVYDLITSIGLLSPPVRARIRLSIAGNGDLNALRAHALDKGVESSIEILGWVPRQAVAPLLKEHDIFILPSYDEGLPLALLEAMSAGLACIVTPVGSIPEVATHMESAILVEPGDTRALAEAITQFVMSPPLRAQLAANAATAIQPLAVERYTSNLERVYRCIGVTPAQRKDA
jgi:glycosyltransferase involved in cell wall biosynthesis